MKYKITLSKLISIVSIAFVLTACTSKPREVNAKIPLVSQSSIEVSGKIISEKYWPILSNPSASYLQHSSASIYLGKPYTSALGNQCRTLDVTQADQKSVHIACLFTTMDDQAGQWYITPDIVEDASLLNL
ncbi:hypothetical protein O7R09_06825 [Vibrio alginolyticus]|uniref:hypothetical protein n=1 Tax=Vibrio alginolyticus TaxID=663 RepID=UPI0022DD0628|nr:hypothetical protein [Vibrio alginolyticus]MDA0420480.1 hypothetical protein [Vibrio alginolyticus]